MNARRLFCYLLIICLSALQPAAASSQGLPAYQAVEEDPIPLPDLPSWLFPCNQNGVQMGYAVAGAGDVNGDGHADVIVGAPKFQNTVYREGTAFVFYGSAGGLQLIPSWRYGGGQKGSGFGASVGGAGDLNGDGYDDVVIGAPSFSATFSDEGAAFVFYGSPTGLRPNPGWTAYGGRKSAQFGFSVAGAGDLNGDGYDDLAVGARWYSGEFSNEGAVFIFYGSETGLSALPDQVFTGGRPNAQLGYSVSGAGDLNGDGYADLAAGAPYYSSDGLETGAVYLFYGSAGGLSPALGSPLPGPQARSTFGAAVSTAGDVNGDGYADLIVGAPAYSGGHDREGAAYVFLGSAAGLIKSHVWTTSGRQPYSGYGISVASAGQVDGDPYDEILVGAHLFSADQSSEGRVFLYRGGPFAPQAEPAWTAEGNKADTWYGFSVASPGDVDGDGISDVIVGAPSYKTGGIITGRAFAYYSTGTTLPPEIIDPPEPDIWVQYLPVVLSMAGP